MANYVLVISSAALAFALQQATVRADAVMGLSLFVLGAYGGLASAKFYERHTYHVAQALAFSEELGKLIGLTDHDTLLWDSRIKHDEAHKLMSRVRLHKIWLGLNGLISLIGVLVFIQIFWH